MTKRNMAVVITPAIIRMKTSGSGLMTKKEVCALKQQTLIVEHLIAQAHIIGTMPPKMKQSISTQTDKLVDNIVHKNHTKNEYGEPYRFLVIFI